MYKLDIKLPIYDCSVKIIIESDIKSIVNRYAAKKKWENGKNYLTYPVHGLTVSESKMKDYYIFYKTESLTVNTIVHEISHVVDFILNEREIEDKGEAKAYLIGYISEKVFDFVFKKSLLINKWYNQKMIDEKPRLLREGDQSAEGSKEGTS